MIYAADRRSFHGGVMAREGRGGGRFGTGAAQAGNGRREDESERGGSLLRLNSSTFHWGAAPNWSGARGPGEGAPFGRAKARRLLWGGGADVVGPTVRGGRGAGSAAPRLAPPSCPREVG